jgi:fructosamine-3-kinase
VIPKQVTSWLKSKWDDEIVDSQPVSGGCISNGRRLTLDSGRRVFLKQNDLTPIDMFAAEFDGLQLLQKGPGPRSPIPYLFGDNFLVTEDLEPASKSKDYGSKLGRKLAQMHSRTSKKFGLDRDNYIGSTPQINTRTEDGHEFFAVHRLGFQTRLAHDKQLLSKSESRAIDELAGSLEQLIPQQSVALIHGDLWAGNAITDELGNGAIIDPAVHFGWAEAELAMTKLFGGFDDEFYAAYADAHPLDKNWQDRLPLYNLYHLLNHLNIFGDAYHSQVMAIVHQFT